MHHTQHRSRLSLFHSLVMFSTKKSVVNIIYLLIFVESLNFNPFVLFFLLLLDSLLPLTHYPVFYIILLFLSLSPFHTGISRFIFSLLIFISLYFLWFIPRNNLPSNYIEFVVYYACLTNFYAKIIIIIVKFTKALQYTCAHTHTQLVLRYKFIH